MTGRSDAERDGREPADWVICTPPSVEAIAKREARAAIAELESVGLVKRLSDDGGAPRWRMDTNLARQLGLI